MDQKTTWDEIRVTVLQKLFLIDGGTVVEDGSTKAYLAAMPSAYNEATRLLSTTNRYITKYFEVPSDGLQEVIEIDLNSIVDDLFQLKPNGIYFSDTEGKVYEYDQEDYFGNDILLLNGKNYGVYRVYYHAYPLKATAETEGTADMQLDPDVASLVPLYMASQLYKDDDNGIATSYRNEFEVGRELLMRERHNGGSGTFICTTGWR